MRVRRRLNFKRRQGAAHFAAANAKTHASGSFYLASERQRRSSWRVLGPGERHRVCDSPAARRGATTPALPNTHTLSAHGRTHESLEAPSSPLTWSGGALSGGERTAGRGGASGRRKEGGGNEGVALLMLRAG